MDLAPCPAAIEADPAGYAAELTAVRDGVARHRNLPAEQREELRSSIRRLEGVYYRHFRDWLAAHRIDWVIAVNMTLSDAVPATAALHQAARDRYHGGNPGGIVFWDHDLYGSCAIPDPDTGRRLYPARPNPLTPLPWKAPYTRWAVVSDALAAEAATYPTRIRPHLVPNILPTLPDTPLQQRQKVFLAQHRLDPGRPLLLNPVRVIPIKGVHLALDFLAALKTAARRRSAAVPYLLVFGALGEDPAYATHVRTHARDLDLDGDVRFLDGVPLASHTGGDGHRHLDEIDLLHLARTNGGGVVFTPAVRDVETIGLGPALAAVAALPCAVTGYDAFDRVYGPEFAATPFGTSTPEIDAAARVFLHVLDHHAHGDPALRASLAANRAIIDHAFPPDGWTALWQDLAATMPGHQTRHANRPATP